MSALYFSTHLFMSLLTMLLWEINHINNIMESDMSSEKKVELVFQYPKIISKIEEIF